jgi:hypothetical protein
VFLSAVVVLDRDAKLVEMIDTLCAPPGLTCRLDGRQQKRHEDSNDRDHD